MTPNPSHLMIMVKHKHKALFFILNSHKRVGVSLKISCIFKKSLLELKTDRQMERQTDRQADKQTGRQTDIQTDLQADKLTEDLILTDKIDSVNFELPIEKYYKVH